jgi:putative PIN family toxin of toxin-antitoxin system
VANKPLVVIDTNVLVAGLRSKRGWSFELLSRIGGESFEHCISVPLLYEYEEVLKRSGTLAGFQSSEIDDFLDFVCDHGRKTLIYFRWEVTGPDPDDVNVLEVATAAGATFIVTYNKRHFEGAEMFGIEVATPLEFLTEIGAVT